MPSLLVSAVDRLFDDAGLFPPARRPMAEALRAHHQAAAGPHKRLVGPFLCPVSRLEELDACVASGLPRPTTVGVIAYDLGRAGRRHPADDGHGRGQDGSDEVGSEDLPAGCGSAQAWRFAEAGW